MRGKRKTPDSGGERSTKMGGKREKCNGEMEELGVSQSVTKKSEECAAGVPVDGSQSPMAAAGMDGSRKKKSLKRGGGVADLDMSPRDTNDVVAENGEEAVATRPLGGSEQVDGDYSGGNVAKKVKVRKTGKVVSGMQVELAEAQSTDVAVEEKSEEGAAGVHVNQSKSPTPAGKDGCRKTKGPKRGGQVRDDMIAENGEEGVVAAPSVGAEQMDGDYSGGSAVKKLKGRKSGKGASRMQLELAETQFTVASVGGRSEEGADVAPLEGSPSHEGKADVVRRTKSPRSGKGASGVKSELEVTLQDANVVLVGISDNCAAVLDGPQSTGDSTGGDVPKKTKSRKSEKGVSSTPGGLVVQLQATDVGVAEKSEEGVAALNRSESHVQAAGDQLGATTEKKEKGRKKNGGSIKPDELDAPVSTDIVMAAESEGVSMNGSSAPLLSSGEHTGADVAQKRKSKKTGQSVCSTDELHAPPLVVVALPALESPLKTRVTKKRKNQKMLPKEDMHGQNSNQTEKSDVRVKQDVHSAVKVNSDELEKQERPRKKKTNKNPIMDSVTGTSLDSLRPVRMENHDETPVGNLAPQVEKESTDVSASANAILEVKADFDKGSSSHVNQKSHNKRKKVPTHISNNAEHTCAYSTVSTSSSSAGLQLMQKNNGIASVPSDMHVTSANSSPMPVAVELPRNMSNETSCSDHVILSSEKENGGLTNCTPNKTVLETRGVSAPDSSLKKRQRRRKGKASQPVIEDTKSTQAEMTDRTSDEDSPIRGVVHDPASRDASNRQSSQLDSCKPGVGSFSFHIDGKEDDSSASRTEKVFQLSSGGGPVNGSLIHNGNASYNLSADLHSEMNDVRTVKNVASSAALSPAGSTIEKRESRKDVVPLDQRLISSKKKKLLVLDLNGILADIVTDYRQLWKAQTPYKKVGGKAVFKRPFCDDFLKFCFENFDVGIWSSRKSYNVRDVVDYLMEDSKHKLLFSWDQSRCSWTGFKTLENTDKPLVLKELKKLWDKEEPQLPWEKGEYLPSNTLLVDDSPYKALGNPPHTAIFPRPYQHTDLKDNSLGPGGDLRVYLEGLAGAEDVQQYVQKHPFGQSAITSAHQSWNYYRKVFKEANK